MNRMEKAALRHIAEYHRYERSPQARIDRELDKQRRAAADRAIGHTPMCGLMKCHPSCTHQRNA